MRDTVSLLEIFPQILVFPKDFFHLSGSYARRWVSGTYKEHSDLDIWVKTDLFPSEEDLNRLYKNLIEFL